MRHFLVKKFKTIRKKIINTNFKCKNISDLSVVHKTYLKNEAEHIKFHIGGNSNKSMFGYGALVDLLRIHRFGQART